MEATLNEQAESLRQILFETIKNALKNEMLNSESKVLIIEKSVEKCNWGIRKLIVD